MNEKNLLVLVFLRFFCKHTIKIIGYTTQHITSRVIPMNGALKNEKKVNCIYNDLVDNGEDPYEPE
jgi:hypothetical protein